MTPITIILILASFLFLAEGIRRLVTKPSPNPVVLSWQSDEEDGKAADQRKKSTIERILPLAERLPKYFGFLRSLSVTDSSKQTIIYAGSPYGLTQKSFFGLQLFGGLCGLAIGLLLVVLLGPSTSVLALGLVGLPFVCFYAPSMFWLRPLARRRQEDIDYAVPELLDLLSIALKAGMGFDHALALITSYSDGPLSDEFSRTLDELSIGVTRRVAFTALIKRNNSQDLRIFVDALTTSEELGTPVSRTLEVQSEEIIKRRMNLAKDKANKAEPKLTLIMLVFFMPATLILFVGILALNLFKDLGSVLGG